MGEFGLIGRKLGHSFSPEVHALLGGGYPYRLIELEPEAVAPFLESRSFDGLNVTIPYKRTVLPLCDALSDEARRIGSVNTIVRQNGRLIGYNTDYYGFCRMAETAGVAFAGKRVLVLGSGGAAATAVTAARDLGAAAVWTVSRHGACDGVIDYPTAYREHADADVIVNATPVGMYPENGASPVELSRFPACTGVLDMIFNPFRTALLQQAERQGVPHAGGLVMLVAQAAQAAALFTGAPVDPAREAQAVRAVTRARENLILIGMPGSGKTTIGRLAARKLERSFVDLDAEIARRFGRTPAEIIGADGEAAFRRLEAQTAADIGRGFGQVIAAGGGTVLRQDAMDALLQNGRAARVDRPLDRLATDGRPLSMDGAALERLLAAREPLYRRYASFTVQNDSAPARAAQAVCRWFTETEEEETCVF